MKTSSPETQLTARHLSIWSLMATIFEPVNSDQSRRMEEIESLLRSLVGPEAMRVVVEREDLADIANALDRVGMIVWAAKIRGWLSSVSTPAPQEEA